MESDMNEKIAYSPVTPERWTDFETLFGEHGACEGCWCMFWRRPSRKEYQANRGDSNKTAMKSIIESGVVPGILAYVDGIPAAWCAVAPRNDYPRLVRSRVLKPVDDQEVWSISCLFINKAYRKRGLSAGLLQAACDFVASRGAKIVEGYPVEPDPDKKYADAFVWNGLASSYLKAGFMEVARRSPTRPIMRKRL
jgi:GNAT superfamily N-acetyltransferase